MSINSDKLLNRPSELHRRYGGRLAMQKAQQEKMVAGGPVNLVLTKKSIKNIEIIKVKVVQIENIFKGTLAFEKKALDEKKRRDSGQRREKLEEKLETKPNVEKGSIKMPSAPRMGILDWIKNFIGNVLLGYFAVRLVDHLPKIIPIVKFLGNAADFIIDVGGKLLNGLATFIDWGYKAYDATRGFIKGLGGEKFAQGFDKFVGAIDTALFLTTFLAGDLLVEALSGDGGGGLGDVVGDQLKKRGAQKAATTVAGKAGGTAAKAGGIGAGTVAAVVAGAGLLASALGEGAFQVRKIAVKPIQNLEKAYKEDRNPLTKIGRGIALTMVRPLYGLFSTVGFLLDVVGAPFRYAIELLRYPFLSEEDKVKQANNLAKFDSRIREDLRKALNMLTLGFAFKEKGSFGNIYGNKGAQKQMMGKMAGGGIARGGKRQTGARRTIGGTKRGKYKRVVPRKPGEIEIKPGADVGGEDKIFGIFPNPLKAAQKAIDVVNPFKVVKTAGEDLGKTDYFGPILAITSKITLGQKPTQRDYENVGLGINMLISKGIQEKQLKGGVVAAFAEGGLVDPDVLSAAETGGDISNWVAKTFQGEIESNAQKTLRMIRENAAKKKSEKTETAPAPEVETDAESGTTGGGTADTSMNPNRRAFLDTLAFAEGTSKYPNTGYNTMFTGKQFSGYKDHPRQLQVSGRYRSDAAGRYQFLSTTWDGLGLSDFSPANQDKGALKLLAPHVIQAIDKGDFATAFHGARKTWASLPGAGYGQPEKKMKTLVGYANGRLQKYKKGEIGKPVTDDISLKDVGGVSGYRVTRSGATIKNYSELPAHHTYQTSADGRRVQDFTLYKGNKFVDIPVPSPVTGKVTWTGPAGGGGNWVEIQSKEGKVELGHFNRISAKVGQNVQAFKSVLGLQGYTGNIRPSGPDGTHVHIQAPDKVIGRYVNSLARGSAFHGENFGIVPKDGFTLKLHKGEMFKVVDKDSVNLLGFDLTKEIIDIENQAQLVAKAPSIIEKLKAISGYASYEEGAPQTIVVPVSGGMESGYGDSEQSGGGIAFVPVGGGSDPFESLHRGG
jgi:muramidase (phage lysozyme)